MKKLKEDLKEDSMDVDAPGTLRRLHRWFRS